MKKIMLLALGLVALGASTMHAEKRHSNNNLLGYPGRVIRQSGEVVGSVFTDLPETPRETVDLAGEVLTPFGRSEN